MNQKKIVFSISLLVIVAIIIIATQFRPSSNGGASSRDQASTLSETSEPVAESSSPTGELEDVGGDQGSPSGDQTSKEVQSLAAMTKVLHSFAKPSVDVSELMKHLEESGQKPTKVTQSNPYTGDMTIVRTDSPLPGTRYFHAQYFSDGDGKNERIQHMAFEFRPSPESMNQVVQSIKETFSGLGEPTHENGNFVGWKLGKEYVIWVNKLAEADLKEHPFNAYSPGDAGTIRIAIQEEIHGEDHAH